MKPFGARALIICILVAVVGGWLGIFHVGADPATGWGQSWFELTLAHVGLTYLALLACYVLWGYSSWKQRLTRAILSVAALLLAVALVELPAAMGWIDYRQVLIPRTLGGAGPHNRQLDPELVYRHLPHDRFVHRQAGDYAAGLAIPTARRYEAECICDANGFRNEVDYRQADVVLLGDSFIEGYNVTQGEIVSTELARLLQHDVCNLALCGYGPQQELGALRRYGAGLHPRVVVWFFYEGNDLFDIEDYENVVNDWEAYLAEQQSYGTRSFFLNILDPLGFWLDQLRWHESAFARRRAGHLLPEIPSVDRVTYIGNPPFQMSDHIQSLFAKLQRILLDAKKVCDRNHIALLVVNVPTKGRVYRDLCTFPADSDVPHWQWNDFPDRSAAWCRASGIEHMDLTPALRGAVRRGRLAYFVDDPHWTAEGHAIVAEEVARSIRAAGWLKSKP